MPSPLFASGIIKLSIFSNALILDLSLVTEIFARAVSSVKAQNHPYHLSIIFNQTCMGWFWADAAAPARPVAPQPTSRSDAAPPVCYHSNYMLSKLVLTTNSLVAPCTMPLPPRPLLSRHQSLPRQMHHVRSLHLTFPLVPHLNPPRLSLN